ncbi:MAG: hypothetical protein QOI11_757 [Candidatus Eremiobacteraeota bacterium]|nr:hypothetical protein [Candidatus Eremiobacteraeota bacterium]
MPTTYLYVDEAGRSRINGGNKNRRQPYFIVGVLLLNDPASLLHAVGEARAAHHFTNEIHWTKQSDLRARVYREVARRIDAVDEWEFRAARLEAGAVDMRSFGGRPHLAYNRFVRSAIDDALRCSQIAVHRGLDVTIDAKQRLHDDDFLRDLHAWYDDTTAPDGTPRTGLVSVREVASEEHDLVQVCDLLSGAHHTMLTAEHCGNRKAALAPDVWLPSHCRAWEFDLA